MHAKVIIDDTFQDATLSPMGIDLDKVALLGEIGHCYGTVTVSLWYIGVMVFVTVLPWVG